jgi:tryptophan synthase alpha chain
MAAIADGVVVGSALVKFFEAYAGSELQTRLTDFVTSLKAGIRSAS